jgi:hypothetical protein
MCEVANWGGAVLLQYNWSMVRLLASPPIRLVVQDQPLPKIIGQWSEIVRVATISGLERL